MPALRARGGVVGTGVALPGLGNCGPGRVGDHIPDLDERRVVDEVDALDGQVQHPPAEQHFEVSAQGLLVGVRGVQAQLPLPMAREQAGMVTGVQRGHDEHHQPGVEKVEGLGQPGQQTERQRREVVGDLVLRDLVRPQPDDRQNPEEPHPHPDPDRRRPEHHRHGEHPDIDTEKRGDQVPPVMPREVDREGQEGDGDEIGADKKQPVHVSGLPGICRRLR